MQASQLPARFPIPFANAAGGSFIRAIPQASQIGIVDGAASLTDGFVPLNMTPVQSGGVPPFGQDFNGLLKQITQWSQWQAAGNAVPYNGTFAAAIGGYPQGAVLASATTAGLVWLSTVDNNVTNPDAGGAGWAIIATASGVQSGQWVFGTATNTNTYTTTLNPSPPSLVQGMEILVYFANANTTTSPTLNVNGGGAKAILKQGGGAPASGDVSGFVPLIFDGSVFRIVGMVPSDIANAISNSPKAVQTIVANMLWQGGTQIVTPGISTFTVPAGVTRIWVDVWSGGGGGGGAGSSAAGGGGCSGAYTGGPVSVSPGDAITVTIGAGGAGGTSGGGGGGSGGLSSFGSFMSCTGGYGGGGASAGFGSAGGTVSAPTGGVIFATGSPGGGGIQFGTSFVGGAGGGSPGGGSTSLVSTTAGGLGFAPGGAGSGGASNNPGGGGSPGRVNIRW